MAQKKQVVVLEMVAIQMPNVWALNALVGRLSQLVIF